MTIKTEPLPKFEWYEVGRSSEMGSGGFGIEQSTNCPQVVIAPHGFVRMVANMGEDWLIAEAARIGRESTNPDENLIRYMMRHKHTSPFEFVRFVFHVRLPIFVARQWMRHRTGVFNEWSARYMELPDTIWAPEKWRRQARSNRQASEGEIDYSDPVGAEHIALQEYRNRLNAGVAREQARACLPLSIYTEFYWGIDLHNLLHFIDLRADEGHAQPEIVDYAMALQAFVAKTVPTAYAAWKEYRAKAMTLTEREIRMVRGEPVEFPSEREMEEAKAKMLRLGLPVVRLDENQNVVSLENPKQ